MRKVITTATLVCVLAALSASPVLAASESAHAAGPLKALEDFAIVFAIALAAGVVGFIAFKSARKRVTE